MIREQKNTQSGFEVTEKEGPICSEVAYPAGTGFEIDTDSGYLWVKRGSDIVAVYPPGIWGPLKALDPTAEGPQTSGSADSPMSVAADNFAANQASAPAPSWTASEPGPSPTPSVSATPPLITTPEGAIPDTITGVPGADNPTIN